MRRVSTIPQTLNQGDIIAVIDSREQRPLDLSPLGTVCATLVTGDYTVRGLEHLVAVERKSLQDLVGCVGRQRALGPRVAHVRPRNDALDLSRKVDAGHGAEAEVGKAFSWLEGLTNEHEEGGAIAVARIGSVRIYTGEEMRRMDTSCRGFLLFLEQVGVLDGLARELVIDRVMALDDDEMDLNQLRALGYVLP